MTARYRSIILAALGALSFLPAQSFRIDAVLPDSAFVPSFAADAHAHRMNVETIELSRNVRSSMGAAIPLVHFDLAGHPFLASLGASVHFELRPMGQAHIVSNDYYVDYLILDARLSGPHLLRFVTGHTSHHLSDNWFERLHMVSAVRYSRDYLRLFYIYNREDASVLFYAGADYAYIFTVGRRIEEPFTFQAGGETVLVPLWVRTELYGAADVKLRQEAGFAATTTLQLGVRYRTPTDRIVRLSVQGRSGLDERGQFFPAHRTFGTLGMSFDL